MLIKIVASKLLDAKCSDIMYEKILERLLRREGMRVNTNNEIKIIFE